MNLVLSCFWLVLFQQVVITSQGPASAPANKPTATGSAPADTQSAVSKEVETILDELERAGKDIKTLQADIRHEFCEIVADEKQTKPGFVRYKAATRRLPARFMVHYYKLISEDTVTGEKMAFKRLGWFCFNGRWLREIHGPPVKSVTDREVVKPGEPIDPFELGKGPFPLPFGQKKSRMMKNFEISLLKKGKDKKAKTENKDRDNTDHLRLIPRKGTQLAKDHKRIELWIDRKIHLPLCILAEDNRKNITTVWFRNIKINLPLKDSDLWLPRPKGYSYSKEPLPD